MNSTATTATTNYDRAAAQIKNRDSKKVGNNTYLIAGNDCIHVRLHATNIVTLHKDGRIAFNSGGWQTVTTKDRMNQYMPDGMYIGQKNFVWYVYDRRDDHSFVNYEERMVLQDR